MNIIFLSDLTISPLDCPSDAFASPLDPALAAPF
jgi:hypothetical protein